MGQDWAFCLAARLWGLRWRTSEQMDHGQVTSLHLGFIICEVGRILPPARGCDNHRTSPHVIRPSSAALHTEELASALLLRKGPVLEPQEEVTAFVVRPVHVPRLCTPCLCHCGSSKDACVWVWWVWCVSTCRQPYPGTGVLAGPPGSFLQQKVTGRRHPRKGRCLEGGSSGQAELGRWWG